MAIYAIITAECSGIPHVHVSSSNYQVDSILWSGFFSAILAFITSLQQSFPDRHHLDEEFEDYSISTRDLSVEARRHIPSNTCVLVVGTPEDIEELKQMAETSLGVYMSFQNDVNINEKWKKEMIRLLEAKNIPDSYHELIRSLLHKLDGCQAVAIYSSDGLRLEIEFQNSAPESLQDNFEHRLAPVLGKLNLGANPVSDRVGLPNVIRLPDGSTILTSLVKDLIILAWCQSSYEGMNRLRFKRDCTQYFGDD